MTEEKSERATRKELEQSLEQAIALAGSLSFKVWGRSKTSVANVRDGVRIRYRCTVGGIDFIVEEESHTESTYSDYDMGIPSRDYTAKEYHAQMVWKEVDAQRLYEVLEAKHQQLKVALKEHEEELRKKL